jgi:hypothetical protein
MTTETLVIDGSKPMMVVPMDNKPARKKRAPRCRFPMCKGTPFPPFRDCRVCIDLEMTNRLRDLRGV